MTKPWKEFRQEIVRLYIQEGRTLRDVQVIMREQHGFNASIRSYRQQFDHWGVGKYKCKRRSRQLDFAAPGTNPISPPITPMLPPMSIPFSDQKHFAAPMSGEPASVDNSWPTARSGIHSAREHRHGKSHSVSLPFFGPHTTVASYMGTVSPVRPYQAPRAALPMMSTLLDETPSGWVHGRPPFPTGDATHRNGPSLCSPKDISPLSIARDHLSPIYPEGKTSFVDDTDWVVPKSAMYSLSDSEAPFHGETMLDSRPRSFQTDISSAPCSLVAAKGYASSTHLPMDRINIFNREG